MVIKEKGRRKARKKGRVFTNKKNYITNKEQHSLETLFRKKNYFKKKITYSDSSANHQTNILFWCCIRIYQKIKNKYK